MASRRAVWGTVRSRGSGCAVGQWATAGLDRGDRGAAEEAVISVDQLGLARRALASLARSVGARHGGECDSCSWVFVLGVGGVLRLAPVLQADFPFGDGGLYLAYVRDLTTNHLIPPLTTTYNGGVTFPYPFLAFEVVSVISSIGRIDPLVVMQFLPPIFSVLSVAAFGWLARAILGEPRSALVATFLYATLPDVYRNTILGGGITKAPAALLVLLALGVGLHALRTGSRRQTLLCACASAGAALTPTTAACLRHRPVLLPCMLG